MEAKNQRKPERHGIKYALATKGQGMLLHFEAWIQFFSLSVRESIGEYTTIGQDASEGHRTMEKIFQRQSSAERSIYFINKIKRIFEK